MYGAELHCPGTPNVYTLGCVLEALVEANCRWYLAERMAGREPPCCSKCANVVWDPGTPEQSAAFTGAPWLIRDPGRGWACRSIAAFDAGVGRAKSIMAGASDEHARATNYVELVSTGPNRWHAIVRSGGERIDPTKGLTRKAA